MRLERTCTYKLSSRPHTPHSAYTTSQTTYQANTDYVDQVNEDLEELNQAQHSFCQQSRVSGSSASFHWLESPSAATEESPVHEHAWTPRNDPSILESPAALSFMTSQDIYLCTTIDRLAIDAAQAQSSCSSFLQEVDPPIVSTIDPINWQIFKIYAVELSTHHKTVAMAIFALQSTFKALSNGIPVSKGSRDAHRAAKLSFDTILFDSNESIEAILTVALLLCLHEMLALDEVGLCLGHVEPDSMLVRRLNNWTTGKNQDPMAVRLVKWLKLLHASGRRGGNPGLLAPSVLRQLPNEANITTPTYNGMIDAATTLYNCLSASVFELYCTLQTLSTEVANLSHYHRSRITSEDQIEVAEIMSGIKKRVKTLWEERPHLMRLAPADIRAQLSSQVAEPLINLIGLCNATYHTEVIEIGRTLSDPPLASSEAKMAMREIQNIIETDWATRTADDRLHAGYLRPLFLCAIESIRTQDTQWAVERLRQIKDPISRSDFFASFAESLAAAQMDKGRRVTTKFFCQQQFGISPPFL